jgi:hypothetical protein
MSFHERLPVMTSPSKASSPSLESITEDFAHPILPENPFPTCITACNSAVVERFGEWAEAQRAKVEADLKRLRDRDEAPEAWELSALASAVREWRVFASFHRLHETRWCPGLLFRLATKTDLLVLCDPKADSSTAGFGERQKQVLAKRGIADRFSWAAARRLVATMGLLEETVPDETNVELAEEAGEPAIVDVAADAPPGDAEASVTADATADAGVTTAGEASAEAPPAAEEPASEEEETEEASGEEALPKQKADEMLPKLRLNRVWSVLPTYTKKQLEGVHQKFGVGLWSQFGDRFYSSMRKPEMLTFVQRVVRHHACLDAAERLTERQLDALHDWMRLNLSEPYQRDEDLRIAARLFGDFQATAALSRDGHGLSPEAWNRYRKADLRRIAAFCYHRFYEVQTAVAHRSEAA